MIAAALVAGALLVPIIVGAARARRSRALAEFSAAAPRDAPLVSVVVPARNEARNVAACVRSILAARYPALEVIVVDDHSTDATGALARSVGHDDARLAVIDAPDLPPGWFGKQSACAAGAAAARGSILIFTDADTRHQPDLLPRAVNALAATGADLLTVAPRQEMASFWERVIQPQVFALLSMRYGGTEHVTHARRAEDAIANGQFLMFPRPAYDALGGHARVRHAVAEDLAFAQDVVRAGGALALFEATEQMSTRMYGSLGEIVRGWRKNVYAGGRTAMPGGPLGRALYPLVLLAAPLSGLAAPTLLALSLTGVLGPAWRVASSAVVVITLCYWAAVYRVMRQPMRYALLYPLGHLLLLYIAASSIARGRRVEWKERSYVAT